MSDKHQSLTGLGEWAEPVTKLIETVAAGIGAVYEPSAIVQRARAQAKASVIMAEAQEQVGNISARAARRREMLELRRQKNIESVVGKTVELLPATVNKEKVDEDWIVQFFNYGQDVGNQEMQLVWARLLAGEVARPGSFSLRTLQTVRVLTQSDAECFRLLCNYIWKGGRYFLGKAAGEVLKRKGLRHRGFRALQSLNLIAATKSVIWVKPGEPVDESYFGRICHITHPGPDKDFARYLEAPSGLASPSPPPPGPDEDSALYLEVYLLSTVGEELVPICGGEPDEEYFNALVKDWQANGLEVMVDNVADAAA